MGQPLQGALLRPNWETVIISIFQIQGIIDDLDVLSDPGLQVLQVRGLLRVRPPSDVKRLVDPADVCDLFVFTVIRYWEA